MSFLVFSTLCGFICLLLAEMGAARFYGFPKLTRPLQFALFTAGITSLVLTVNFISKGFVTPSVAEWNITLVTGVFAVVVIMGAGFKMLLDSFD